MNKDFEMEVTVLDQAGYQAAITGVGLNKNQTFEHISDEVAPKLCKLDGGHNKFLEHIQTWLMVRAPRYWWQEADTFRLSSKNSQSTMHTILKGPLTAGDFECGDISASYLIELNQLIDEKELIKLKRKIPEGFLQKRMWHVSFKTLRHIILQRKHHKLPHWHYFIDALKGQLEHVELLPF